MITEDEFEAALAVLLDWTRRMNPNAEGHVNQIEATVRAYVEQRHERGVRDCHREKVADLERQLENALVYKAEFSEAVEVASRWLQPGEGAPFGHLAPWGSSILRDGVPKLAEYAVELERQLAEAERGRTRILNERNEFAAQLAEAREEAKSRERERNMVLNALGDEQVRCTEAEHQLTALRAKLSGEHVYVLIANDGERVKECIVLRDKDAAWRLFELLKRVWGGANVACSSRQIDEIPFLLRLDEQQEQNIGAAQCGNGEDSRSRLTSTLGAIPSAPQPSPAEASSVAGLAKDEDSALRQLGLVGYPHAAAKLAHLVTAQASDSAVTLPGLEGTWIRMACHHHAPDTWVRLGGQLDSGPLGQIVCFQKASEESPAEASESDKPEPTPVLWVAWHEEHGIDMDFWLMSEASVEAATNGLARAKVDRRWRYVPLYAEASYTGCHGSIPVGRYPWHGQKLYAESVVVERERKAFEAGRSECVTTRWEFDTFEEYAASLERGEGE